MKFVKNLGPVQKRILLVLVVVVLVFGGIGVYRFINKSNESLVDTKSKTTSDEESAQSDFTGGDKRDASQSKEKPEVGVVDTAGSSQQSSGSASLKSSDGKITVFSPNANSVFVSGSSLSGEASGQKVSYRLMDDVSGVTATGELNLVNGKFSGRFNFSTSANQGRLDVFQTGPGGVEQSIVEIPVRFK